MTFARAAALIVTIAVTGAFAPARAEDSGRFVVQLGQDTTSVETYTRTATRLEVDQLGRAPRLLRRHFIYDFASGALGSFSMVVTPPGAAVPTQTIHGTLVGDSLQLQVQSGNAAAQNSKLALPPGTVVTANSSPWTTYEAQIMKMLRDKKSESTMPLYLIGAQAPFELRLRKQAKDKIELSNDHGDVFHVRVDGKGRILAVTPISGTGKFTVTRVAALDVDVMAADFAAREKAGKGLGALSPRDTVNVANAGGATLWVDYGRPHKRGRVVFGDVVPWDQVWRTGANAATQFKTDKALDFGGTIVPAGFYTLWTIPSAGGWKLIVNSETGQWGTERKPEKDLYTIAMQVATLAQPMETFTISVEPTATGGVLHLDWDTTDASAAFKVAP